MSRNDENEKKIDKAKNCRHIAQSIKTDYGKLLARLEQSTTYQPHQKKAKKPPIVTTVDSKLHTDSVNDIMFRISKYDATRAINDPPIGLINLGYTCFMNAALQLLLNMHIINYPLIKRIQADPNIVSLLSDSCLRYIQLMIQIDIAKRINKNKIAPRMVADYLGKLIKAYVVGRQEDAHEFLIPLLDTLKLDPQISDLIDKIYIKHTYTITCGKCGRTSEKIVSYSMIPISYQITQSCAPNGYLDLDHAINLYTKPELIEYRCDIDNKKYDASQQLELTYGDAFIVHFPGNFVNINLSIKPIITRISDSIILSGKQYYLSAFIVHIGSGYKSGHYIAYVKKNNKWWCADDSSVYEIKHLNGLEISWQIYIAFYSIQTSNFFA